MAACHSVSISKCTNLVEKLKVAQCYRECLCFIEPNIRCYPHNSPREKYILADEKINQFLYEIHAVLLLTIQNEVFMTCTETF